MINQTTEWLDLPPTLTLYDLIAWTGYQREAAKQLIRTRDPMLKKIRSSAFIRNDMYEISKQRLTDIAAKKNQYCQLMPPHDQIQGARAKGAEAAANRHSAEANPYTENRYLSQEWLYMYNKMRGTMERFAKEQS